MRMNVLLTITTWVTLMALADCQMYNLYNQLYSPNLSPNPNHNPYQRQNPYPDGFVTSYASAIPGSSFNAISERPSGSNLPPPQAPQVFLANTIGRAPNQVANQMPSSQPPTSHPAIQPMTNNLPIPGLHQTNPVNMASSPLDLQPRGQGLPATGSVPSGGQVRAVPLTRKMKKMVTTVATSLGFKSYYDAHGCVDPTTILRGQNSRMAAFAFMLGCNTRHADEACQLAQLAQGGPRVARMRMLMEMVIPPETKHSFEQCLSPSTLMSGMTSMMGGLNQRRAGGISAPFGAAQGVGGSKPDCSVVSQMLMMNPSAAEMGVMSPESMEQIGIMRNKYFKMTCQENLLMGSLPYRTCCPGKVRPPTMQEAMLMRGMGGGA